MKKQTILLSSALLLITGLKSQNTFPATGNVGIGTLAPTESLTVLTGTGVTGIAQTNGTIKVGISVGAAGGYYGTISNHPLFFRTNNSSGQVSLLQNGNFGIGTSTPTERLAVRSASGVLGFSHTDGTVKLGSLLNGSGALFGTTSNHPLYFRTNNSAAQITLLQNGRVGIGTTSPVGKLDITGGDIYIQGLRAGLGGGDDTTNTAFGRNALLNNVPNIETGAGVFNTAFGLNALRSNYHYANTAVGADALRDNTDGQNNTAMGASSLQYNIDGSYNTAVGNATLVTNTSGWYNIAIGHQTLYDNKTGNNNTAIGNTALASNTGGSDNIAFGEYTLQENITGNQNIGIGLKASFTNTTGNNNTAVGVEALYHNVASENTAIGYKSLDSNRTGVQNAAVGNYALFNNKTGNWNTSTGRYSLYNNTTGSENTALGDDALFNNTTGSFNTGVGYLATPTPNNLTNTSAFGYNARTTASNQVRIGNSSVTSIGGWANWTNISDGRVKQNIKENVPGLDFINLLKPVTYNLNLNEAERITKAVKADEKNIKDEKLIKEVDDARKKKEEVIYTGFVAQDVEKAAKALNYNFSGVDVAKNENDLYGLRYSEFVVPLVKSVQELSKKNDDLQKEVNELKAMISAINKKLTGAENQSGQISSISSASLEQNIPNPFSNTTSISYMLPDKNVPATIVLTDKSGKTLKEVNVSGRGKGIIHLDAATLSKGAYQYSLYVNGNLVGTRQMISSR